VIILAILIVAVLDRRRLSRPGAHR
jgi:hypothetical protein